MAARAASEMERQDFFRPALFSANHDLNLRFVLAYLPPRAPAAAEMTSRLFRNTGETDSLVELAARDALTLAGVGQVA